MSYEMKMFMESAGMTALVAFGIWGAFHREKLIEWEKRHGIDFTADLCAIGRWMKKLAWTVLCLLSFVLSKIMHVSRAACRAIKAQRNKRTRMVYVAPKHGYTIGTYKSVRG